MTERTKDRTDEPSLIGSGRAFELLESAIWHSARSDATVLISGESGTGKEVAARLIHARSARRAAPFVAINCAGLSDTLLESELFGHVRGSFTDAHRDRPGLIEAAAGGTILFDETSEMTPRLQGLLLRFLDQREIQRVGSDAMNARVNVRVIAATNKELHAEVAREAFRADLYYRLNVMQLRVPPLRERLEDLPALLDHLLAVKGRRYGTPPPVVSAEALEHLRRHTWPGNVRELRNLAERLVITHGGGRVEASDLPEDVRPSSADGAAPAAALGPINTEAILERMVSGHESFWSAVYDPFMSRDLTRAQVASVVRRGLEMTRGDVRLLVQLFNMESDDDKPFRSFLRRHQCHMHF